MSSWSQEEVRMRNVASELRSMLTESFKDPVFASQEKAGMQVRSLNVHRVRVVQVDTGKECFGLNSKPSPYYC